MAAIGVYSYLLDTGILLHLNRGSTLAGVLEAKYALCTTPSVPLISVVTVGELNSLARQLGWGQTRWLRLQVLLQQVHAIPLETAGIIDAYGEIDHYSIRIGRTMGKNDLWIAATAHVTGARLLTLDQDFDHLDPQFLTRDYIDPKAHP